MFFFQELTDYRCMEKKETKGNKRKIVDRIDSKAAEVGISKPELAARAGIAKNTFANWAARGTVPPADTALVIADALRCSVRWLITGVEDRLEEYSFEEKNLITNYRNLSDQGRYEVKALLEAKRTPVKAEKKQNAG